MANSVSPSCGNCRHCKLGTQGIFDNMHLMCRLNPPRSHILTNAKGEVNLSAFFPIVDKDWSCGRFDPTPTVQKSN